MTARALDLLLRGYQFFLSPYLGGHCRYHPTCSVYARDAIAEHGAAQGVWLAMTRVSRCHPFARGGLDPVPPRDA